MRSFCFVMCVWMMLTSFVHQSRVHAEVKAQHALKDAQTSTRHVRTVQPQDHPQPEELILPESESPQSSSDLLYLLKRNYAFISKNYHSMGQLKLGTHFKEFTGDDQWEVDHVSHPKFIHLERHFIPGDLDAHYLFGALISSVALSFLDQKLARIQIKFSLMDAQGRYNAKIDRKILSNFRSIYQKLGHPQMILSPSTDLDEVYEAEPETRDIVLRRYLTKRDRGSWKNDTHAVMIERILRQNRRDLDHPPHTQSMSTDHLTVSLVNREAQESLDQLNLELNRQWTEHENLDWYELMKSKPPHLVCPESLSCLMRGLEAREFRNYSKAGFFFDMACRRGQLKGCVSLGVLYFQGLGVKHDMTKAFKLYRRACRGGHVIGCTNLGVMYESGSGVARDHDRAVKLYIEACQAGYGRACGNLGVIYYADGDMIKGALYDARACEEGDGRGCSNLGYDYEHGAGVQVNWAKAQIFYTKACHRGYKEACISLKKLAKRSSVVPSISSQHTP